jgi:hypothetical protein
MVGYEGVPGSWWVFMSRDMATNAYEISTSTEQARDMVSQLPPRSFAPTGMHMNPLYISPCFEPGYVHSLHQDLDSDVAPPAIPAGNANTVYIIVCCLQRPQARPAISQ